MRSIVRCLFIALALLPMSGAVDAAPATPQNAAFPVAPHNDVSIEWWYLNTHLQTKSGRHLAVITSFFRFGNAQALKSQQQIPTAPAQQSHYLIYAVTDEDSKTHKAFSLADTNSLRLLQQLATLAVMQNPSSKQAQELLALTGKGTFPPPTVLIAGACRVTSSPRFAAVYGSAASLRAVPGKVNTFQLAIGAPETRGGLHLNMTFASTKPPMYVNGSGNTGVAHPEDMKYVSLTRCAVNGTIDTGSGAEPVAAGAEGWFDHQWGSSWTPQAVGWDWWGVQLSDGRDILFFRQRYISDGSLFGATATIEDKAGHQTTTHNIVFTPNLDTLWESPATHVPYPLDWTVTMPEQNLQLTVSPDMQDQEMPILANGGAIWEGSVKVNAVDLRRGSDVFDGPAKTTPGVGYMELVGYGAQAVAKQFTPR